MNKEMNLTETANKNTVINALQTTEAATYVKPAIEVIEMEMEGAILTDSATGQDYGNGGRYGR
jgi:hypothetical protein